MHIDAVQNRISWILELFIEFDVGGLKQVCKSSGGRFPPFLSEGNPPGKVAKGPRDLVFCGVFRKYTCCDVAQTYPALVSVRKLASTGQANHECLHLWELLECSICDPRVGTQIGPPVICTSFCDSLWKACYDAFFSFDSKTQVILISIYQNAYFNDFYFSIDITFYIV